MKESLTRDVCPMIPRYQRYPLDPSDIEVIFARSCDIEIRLLRKLLLSLGGKNKGEYARLQRWRWHLPGVSFNIFQSIKRLAVQDTNVKDIFEPLGDCGSHSNRLQHRMTT
jgi:hypothetical protein